jgi:hypothetical protein
MLGRGAGAIGSDLEKRLEVVQRLLATFRFERMVHLAVTLIALLVLLTCAIAMLVQKTEGYIEVFGLFGASGAITITCGKVLRMWNDALVALQMTPKGDP